MKSQLREAMSLILHGPIEAEDCVIFYYDRVLDKIRSISFNEFLELQHEFGIPDHRIRAIVSTKNGLKRVLFQRPNSELPKTA